MREKHFDVNDETWREALPVPVYDCEPGFLTLYMRAWEIARSNLKSIPGMPCNPYMDENFSLKYFWIWDSCFMALYCKYANTVFPGVETLDNFYEPFYGTKGLPCVQYDVPTRGFGPEEIGVPVQLTVHIPDNPPLFAWAEYANALISGDKKRLEYVYSDKKFLQKHFEMLENLTEKGGFTNKYANRRAPTCWQKRENGYLWEGGRSGMDNTPRGRTVEKVGKTMARPNNPDMLWLDAICEQADSAYFIVKIAELLGDEAGAAEWRKKYDSIKEKVNRLYWDDEDKAYYDISESTLKKYKVLSISSMWPLACGIASPEQAEAMARKIADPALLGDEAPTPSLSRSDADYMPSGNYWRGAIWLPTSYMAVKGLENYGKWELARETAKKILVHMDRTYREFTPHTIWECYSADYPAPGTNPDDNDYSRPDFCGWSALGPVALFIENVIGFTSIDAFRNTIEWHKPETDKAVGIRNLSFGKTTCSIVCENNVISTVSDGAFTLVVNGKTLSVPVGTASFNL